MKLAACLVIICLFNVFEGLIGSSLSDEKWDEVKAFLASADKDGNGVLSKDEFKGGIAALGVSDEAAAVVQESFDEIDKDGSGTLSIQELIAWVDSDRLRNLTENKNIILDKICKNTGLC